MKHSAYFIGEGNYEEALLQVDNALDIKPDSYKALKYKAVIFYELNYLSEANTYIDKSLEYANDIESLELFLLKGTLQEELGDPISALKCFSQTIIIDSNYIDGLYKRGWLLTRIKDYESAYNDFKRIQNIDSTSDEINHLIKRLETHDFKYFHAKSDSIEVENLI